MVFSLPPHGGRGQGEGEVGQPKKPPLTPSLSPRRGEGGCFGGFSLRQLRVKPLGPGNSSGGKEPGGTGFPACAKNTLLFTAI
jgi:hypothetical protein